MSSHIPEFQILIFLKKHIFKGQKEVKIWGPKQDRTQGLRRDSSEMPLLVRRYMIFASPLTSLGLLGQRRLELESVGSHFWIIWPAEHHAILERKPDSETKVHGSNPNATTKFVPWQWMSLGFSFYKYTIISWD